ncbi:MAG: A/G-specific adenine glycosylase [Candidatus Paceibacteria bacterium]
MTGTEKRFVQTVLEFYEVGGRHGLPWRQTKDPYRILVSEVMLQQTQVDRVIPKYNEFLKAFPTISALAEAPLGAVLGHWQGLGYNRRAKMLHECAKVVVRDFGGKLPKDETKLRTLPGIGPYTARAVLAFAFGIAEPLIETNVRTVYIHHFFADETDVTDAMLLPYIKRTLPLDNPRAWYYALMDYGSHLKRTVGNNITKSKHYTKQSTFKGSDRQIRGAIIKLLATGNKLSYLKLKTQLPFDEVRLAAQLERLIEEGMVIKTSRLYQLPS